MAKLTDLLVVSDLDGTLLQAGYGIPKANLDAIERFTAEGGRFTLATGRSVASVRRYMDWIHPTVPLILINGALIYDFDREEVLYDQKLPDTVFDIIQEVMATFPDLGVELHNARGITVARQNEQTNRHLEVEHTPYDLADINHLKGIGWNKALFACPESKMRQINNFFGARRKTPTYREFEFVRSSSVFLEVISKNINKGTGLKKLAELTDTPLSNTVAIGDYFNDLSMFEVAGYSAAVADAPIEVRSRADITVSSCLQGGLGEFINSLGMICDGFEQLRLDM